jgi:CBS domain-containing protein
MDIRDIATPACPTVETGTRVGELPSTFEDEHDGVIVVEDREPVGTVTPRELVRSHIDDDAGVGTVSRGVPTVQRSADVREVARLFVENRAAVLPVMEGGALWGSVTRDALLDAVVDNLKILTVAELHTPDVVAISEDAALGEAVNQLRENGISRLPVVEDDGTLAGIVTTTDLVELVVRDPHAPPAGSADSGDQRILDLPVTNAMSRPAETVDPESSVADAVETMLEKGYDGLVVSPSGQNVVGGMITKTDVLRALTYTETEKLDVQISNVELLDAMTRDEIGERVMEIAEKHREMYVEHVHLRLQKHSEQLRGRPLIRCSVRMWTDEEQVAGTGEGYGGDEAVSLALDTLERNVLEMKGRNDDEAERDELLQKLHEL